MKNKLIIMVTLLVTLFTTSLGHAIPPTLTPPDRTECKMEYMGAKIGSMAWYLGWNGLEVAPRAMLEAVPKGLSPPREDVLKEAFMGGYAKGLVNARKYQEEAGTLKYAAQILRSVTPWCLQYAVEFLPEEN